MHQKRAASARPCHRAGDGSRDDTQQGRGRAERESKQRRDRKPRPRILRVRTQATLLLPVGAQVTLSQAQAGRGGSLWGTTCFMSPLCGLASPCRVITTLISAGGKACGEQEPCQWLATGLSPSIHKGWCRVKTQTKHTHTDTHTQGHPRPLDRLGAQFPREQYICINSF